MMNNLVQWRQVPLPETKLEPPPPEKPHHSYRFFCQILVNSTAHSICK